MGNIIGLQYNKLNSDSDSDFEFKKIKELDTDSNKELDTDSSKELDTDSSKELDTNSNKELDTDSSKELDSDKILNDALDDQFGTSDKIRFKSEIEDLLKENMILRKTLSILSFFVIGLNVIGFFVLIRP